MNHFSLSKYRTYLLVTAVLLGTAVACSPNPENEVRVQTVSPDAVGAVSAVTIAYVEDLLQASRGKVTVVNFWATWCPPCVAEMPELAEFYREHAGNPVAFHALSLDSVDDIEDTVKPFMEKHKIPFPTYVLAERDIEAVSKAVGSEISGALPVTLVYDKQGNVQRMWEGAITLDELNGLVKPLL